MKTIKLSGFALAMTLSFGLLTSCGSDDDSPAPLPPIGGYNNANEVGASNLVAYWPLDGNGTESKSNTAPTTTVGTTFVAGAKGEAANFAAGYMVYPSIAALATSSGSMTISAWGKISNNKTDVSATASCILTLTRPGSDWAGNVNLILETSQREASNDSIQVKGLVKIKKADGSENGQDVVNMIKQEPWMDAAHSWAPNKVGGQWAQYVIVWNGTAGTFKIWVNGVEISNNAWEVRNGGDSLPLSFFTPTYPVIGAFGNVATTSDTWNKPLTGQLDEIRIWNKALTAADINSLYELEKAGR